MRKLIPLLLLSLFQVSLIGCSNSSYIKPDLGMASRLAGKAYTEGRCEDAIPHYLEIIKEFPQDTDSRLRIANCLYLTGDVSAAEVVELTEVTTLQGGTAAISVTEEGVTIDGAKVLITDLDASNGVVHVIDTVMIPDSE